MSPMVWQIIDVRSNLLDEFDDEASALAAVREMIAREPEVTEEIGLLAFDDDGNAAFAPALNGASLLAAVDGAEGRQGHREA